MKKVFISRVTHPKGTGKLPDGGTRQRHLDIVRSRDSHPTNSKKKQRPTPLQDERPRDIFTHHTLVESPRRLQHEQTVVPSVSELGLLLEDFYSSIAEVSEDVVSRGRQCVIDFVRQEVVPRVQKLVLQIGLRLNAAEFVGSFFDDTCVIELKNADILLVCEKARSPVNNVSPSYKSMTIPPHVPTETKSQDAFRFGRSRDGTYLSPLVTCARLHAIFRRALKSLIAKGTIALEDYNAADGEIRVVYNSYTLRFVPSFTRGPSQNSYLITRPYAYDKDPLSDTLWRLSHHQVERDLLNTISRADRGVRLKAYQCMKALTVCEPTFHSINTYMIKTCLMHLFEAAVDSARRWQRTTLDVCFLQLIQTLGQFLADQSLPSFFESDCNLIEDLPYRDLYRLNLRIHFLLTHPDELAKIVRKRTHEMNSR